MGNNYQESVYFGGHGTARSVEAENQLEDVVLDVRKSLKVGDKIFGRFKIKEFYSNFVVCKDELGLPISFTYVDIWMNRLARTDTASKGARSFYPTTA